MCGPLDRHKANTLPRNDLHHSSARAIARLHDAFRKIRCTVQDGPAPPFAVGRAGRVMIGDGGVMAAPLGR